MSKTKRNCNYCGKEYQADNRNLKRGWGLCCNKSCSASLRERSKPTWNAETVERNNEKRNWKFPNYPDEDGFFKNKYGRYEKYPDDCEGLHPFSSEGLGQD